MSARALNWAWERMPQVPGTPTKLVLVAIADRADDAGVCWPSYRTLAEKCSVAEDTIYRAVNRLEQADLLARKRRRREDGTLSTWEFHLALDGVPGDQSALLPPGESAISQESRQPVRSSPGAETNSRDEEPSSAAPRGHSLVAHFVDEVRRVVGRDPIPSVLGRLGRDVKRLEKDGVPEATIRRALTEVAEQKLAPASLVQVAARMDMEHREKPKLPAATRARQYVVSNGWQLTDADLAEILGREFGLEGPERNELLETARNVRASREKAAA